MAGAAPELSVTTLLELSVDLKEVRVQVGALLPPSHDEEHLAPWRPDLSRHANSQLAVVKIARRTARRSTSRSRSASRSEQQQLRRRPSMILTSIFHCTCFLTFASLSSSI